MRPRFLLLAGGLLAALAFLLLLGGADSTHAGTFNPKIRFCFDNFDTVDPNPIKTGDPNECDGTNAAGAAATFALGFDIDEGDVNFAGLVTYIPGEWTITRSDQFPIGSKVGLLESIATIGIINGPCNNTLNLLGTAGFTLFNASTDIKNTIEFQEKEGKYADQDPNVTNDTTKQDWAEDLNSNSLFDGVDKYPAYINRLLKDKDDKPLQPFRRSAGTIIVAGVNVLIQYLVFDPGTFINKNLPQDPALGYPTVVLLQNAGDPDLKPQPSAITDFCTPLGATVTSFGKADPCDNPVNDDNFGETKDDDKINDGCPALGAAETGEQCDNNKDDDRQDDRKAAGSDDVRINDGCPQAGSTSEGDPDFEWITYRNPSKEGTYTITTIAVGQGDSDSDGYENSLDTCPLVANVGNARVKGDGDADEDGLDTACDPNDNFATGGGNVDQDLDGYQNRQDNCPLIANGEDGTNQKESDVDADGDRQIDGLGDECDPDKLAYSAEPLQDRIRTITADVEIGPCPPGDATCEVTDEPPVVDGGDEGGGLATGAIIGIVVGIAAAVIVVGGGGAVLLRRGRRSGS